MNNMSFQLRKELSILRKKTFLKTEDVLDLLEKMIKTLETYESRLSPVTQRKTHPCNLQVEGEWGAESPDEWECTPAPIVTSHSLDLNTPGGWGLDDHPGEWDSEPAAIITSHYTRDRRGSGRGRGGRERERGRRWMNVSDLPVFESV